MTHRTKPHLAKLFTAHPQIIDTWFGQKGFSGELSDKMLGYFQSKSGLSSGTLFDHINATVNSMGYSGNFQDQLSAFFDAQVGSKGTRVDNEIAFWQDFTKDFSGVINNGVTFNGDQVTFNGQPVTFTP